MDRYTIASGPVDLDGDPSEICVLVKNNTDEEIEIPNGSRAASFRVQDEDEMILSDALSILDHEEFPHATSEPEGTTNN